MPAQLLDGRLLASQLKAQLQKDIEELRKTTGTVPHLKNVMIGDDPSAMSYANSQKKTAEQLGIKYELVNLPKSSSHKEVVAFIDQLNRDPNVHGVMIYKPVPEQIDYNALVNMVDTRKDLEGINEINMGRMFLGEPAIIPCTPAAVIEHIRSTGIDLSGKEAVIVGRSEIVGKPLIVLLLQMNATVTVCHSGTSKAGRLEEHLGRADLVVAAVGKPNFVKGEWIKEGAMVIDVGINQVGDKIVGDVEFATAKERASFITPVPGGVGPVTVVMLMRNAVKAYKLQLKSKK